MRFVKQLPARRGRTSRYDQILGAEGHETLRRNPSRWALIAESAPKKSQSGFSAWARKRGYQPATRENPRDPNTIDLYLRYQPGGREQR